MNGTVSARQKEPRGRRTSSAEVEDASSDPFEGEVEGDENEDRAGHTVDPVKSYLRAAGSRSLLTREQEVKLAKQIEEGERRVLDAVLRSRIAIEELLQLCQRLRNHQVRVEDVVSDLDEKDPDFDEAWHLARVLRSLVKVGRHQRKNDHTLEEVGRVFGWTRERIRQIEAKALRKLRHPSRASDLKAVLEN